jgi:hypothetical protein
MPVAERLENPRACDIEARLASLKLATSRRVRLEGLFANSAFLDKTLSDGRYLRLCTAIAWASAREEEARRAVETDHMVARLREAKTP